VTAADVEQDFPAQAASRLGEILSDLGVSYESPRPGAFLVRLEGQHSSSR